MKINIKKLTRANASIDKLEIDTPSGLKNVRELIEYVTGYCVNEYEKRREAGELLKMLEKEEIEDKAKSGKVGFGVNYGTKSPKMEEAKKNSVQSFGDGVTALFIDGKRMESLEEAVEIKDETELTFIKLTAYAGRMW